MKEMNTLLELRRQKLEDYASERGNPFPNNFKVSHTTYELRERFEQVEGDELEKVEEEFSLAGRVMSLRNFGKASFIHLQDGTGKIQAYIQKDEVPEENFKIAKKLDVGDFVGIKGKPSLTVQSLR